MPSVRLFITGRVQGVGFRYALQQEAARRGLRGWVRNRRDGSVEALVQGDAAALESMASWARRGPPGAQVNGLSSAAAEGEPERSGFEVWPTA